MKPQPIACRSCGAQIVFLRTSRNKSIPVDIATVAEGEETFDHKKHRSHFATCPNAAMHRQGGQHGKAQ